MPRYYLDSATIVKQRMKEAREEAAQQRSLGCMPRQLPPLIQSPPYVRLELLQPKKPSAAETVDPTEVVTYTSTHAASLSADPLRLVHGLTFIPLMIKALGKIGKSLSSKKKGGKSAALFTKVRRCVSE